MSDTPDKKDINPDDKAKKMRSPAFRSGANEASVSKQSPGTDKSKDDEIFETSPTNMRRPSINRPKTPLEEESLLPDEPEDWEDELGEGSDDELDESSDEEKLVASGSRLKAIWNSRAFSRVLIGLSLIFFALGIYYLVKPIIVHKNQDRIADDLLEKLKELDPDSTEEVTIEVNVKDIHLPGSYSDEYDYILPPGEKPPEETGEKPQKTPSVVTIRTDSIMRIPRIGLEIAVAPNVSASSLWVLPGHYPTSPQPGSIGVTSYFGHRMYGKGRHFNRLNEVGPGDSIQIQRQGMLYNYVIDTSDIVEPTELGKYVYERTSEARILLVTCHPIQTTGIPKYRIVVRGHLESTEPVQ